MSSIIDSQNVNVGQILAPICTDANTGSPSLVPYAGSLCYDTSTPGVLYVGNLGIWKNVGLSNIDELEISNVTLVDLFAVEPNLVFPKLSLQRITSGNVSMVMYSFAQQTTFPTISANVSWYGENIIPIGFRPSGSAPPRILLPYTVVGSFDPINMYMSIGVDGSLTCGINVAVPTQIAFYQQGGVYTI